MKDRQSNKRIYQSVHYLTSILVYVAILLRSILLFQGTPYLADVLGILLGFMLLFVLGSILSTRLGSWFHLYMALQTGLVYLLLANPNLDQYDYFSLLFAILGMQVLERLDFRTGFIWICVFLALTGFVFINKQGILEGVIILLLFGSVIVLLSAYALATRRAQLANNQNQYLMGKLGEANLELESHSNTLKQLGIAHERQRLRRELHDSVTQTIFSMTLTTQSALLLLDRDPSRVGTQLERLNQLSQSALDEMHTLISELRPDQQARDGLAVELRQHVQNRHLPDGLTVTVEIEGDQLLSVKEEQGLFRIVQEALNNVVKHAQATSAVLRLHLSEPYWIEIEDNGIGFTLDQTPGSGRLGLAGMKERADEINWVLSIHSNHREGTRIRIEKKTPVGESA